MALETYEEDVLFDESDVFLWTAEGTAHPGRLTGWYYCRSHGEFIKQKGKRYANCPFCNQKVERLMTLDSANKYATLKRWKAQGTYSSLAADE